MCVQGIITARFCQVVVTRGSTQVLCSVNFKNILLSHIEPRSQEVNFWLFEMLGSCRSKKHGGLCEVANSAS
jgi:hypothetical protein